jgi:uncharacterized phosphosugar-binding protein
VEVAAADMAGGIALAQFYLGEAARLTEAATVSAEIERAETLRRWLLESWPHSEVARTEVMHKGPNALRESPKAQAALKPLEAHGWIVPLAPGTEVRGKARKAAGRIVRGAADVV